jgi:hypothetical protein
MVESIFVFGSAEKCRRRLKDYADAGVTAIIQPGGSKKDADTVAVADANDMAMVFTGSSVVEVTEVAATADEPNGQVVQAQVDDDLLETPPGDERCYRVEVHDLTLQRQARRHADDVLLADAFHEIAFRHLGLELLEGTNSQVRPDKYHAPVLLRQFIHHVQAGLAHQQASNSANNALTSSSVTFVL